MVDHYYTQTPSARTDRQIIEAKLRGELFKFVTDAGVFSKAGIDFGSRLLIESLVLRSDANILDIGCGYGSIGLAAAKQAASGTVTMIDVNERAVELARSNAELNRVTNVEIIQSDLYEAVANKRFSVILTNPPIRAGKETVHRIFEEGRDLLVQGGEMWVVIQKKQGAASTLAKLQQLYEKVVEVTKDKGYRIFRAIKS